MEDGLGVEIGNHIEIGFIVVLILVLVEDGLGVPEDTNLIRWIYCLNPCFSGGWSRRNGKIVQSL